MLIAAVLAGAPAAVAATDDPAPATPAWYAREAQNFADADGRAADWSTNPGAPQPGGTDPLRAVDRWNGARGEVIPISYRNRYQAKIVGHLWRPKGATGSLPAVVFVDGAGEGDSSYFWAAEDLAEHGYLVMTFDPQGQGASDTEPAARYCEAGGAWTKPQEMGIREQGSCAGEDPPDAQFGEAFGLGFVATGKAGNEDARGTERVYREIAPRFVFGTLDAAAFLLSDANPWRASVDPARVGVAGHSAGAWAALMVANGDPKQRFRAAVAMDAYHGLDYGVTGRRPTLFLQSEQENVMGPRTVPPSDPRSPDQLHATRGAFADLRSRGIDTGFVVLRGSTHNDFTDLFIQASRTGQRVASYYMLAWLDAHLRGASAARLRAERFDTSADASSIGTGASIEGRNVPYVIGGDRVADHLSFYYPADLFLARRTCLDLRLHACPAPPPKACTSRRVITLHLRRPARVTADAGRVTVRGRAARIDLRGLGPRTVTVRAGDRVRRYRTCVTSRPRRAP